MVQLTKRREYNMQSQTKQIGIAASLALLMAATRFHHFGSAVSLPDASLAVFFLAGFYLSGLRTASVFAFIFLLLEAGGIDFYACAVRGVSDFCVSPAYWFLIPTYGVMVWAGRWSAARARNNARGLGLFAGASFVSTSVAFLVSNGSFYLFSGRYPGMGVSEYAVRVAQYYPLYLGSALMYLGAALLIHVAAMNLQKSALAQQ
jgi:hypothetical protein